jgi:hypothetical protein
MKQPKSILLWGIGAAAVIGAVCFPSPLSGQAAGDEQAIAQLVTEVAAQQAQIIANQQVIDQKLAVIEENVRIARIFVSRGGGKAK